MSINAKQNWGTINLRSDLTDQKAKSKILTACGLIRLCRHCRRVWWSIVSQKDELSGIGL